MCGYACGHACVFTVCVCVCTIKRQIQGGGAWDSDSGIVAIIILFTVLKNALIHSDNTHTSYRISLGYKDRCFPCWMLTRHNLLHSTSVGSKKIVVPYIYRPDTNWPNTITLLFLPQNIAVHIYFSCFSESIHVY